MRYITLFIFVFLSCVSRAQFPFTQVRLLMHDDNPGKALLVLDSCQFKNYRQDSVLFYKGLTHLKMGDLKSAKKNCNTLLRSYPAFTDAHYLNGLILFSDENYGKSIDEFGLALKTTGSPFSAKALYNRSVAFGILEDYLSAIEDLGACININPNYALAYYSRGYWYEFTGNYTDATKDYESSIRLDPKNYDAYYGLAFIYQNQKETAKACEVINRAIGEGSQIAEELKNNFCR